MGISHSLTTLSVARYNLLSYRTVQRFYALKEVNWLLVNLLLFKHFVYQKGKTYLLAADETVSGKAGNTIIHYYSLRFQIEFDFRDAKQFFGLSDFKNYKETQVSNAVNIAFSMPLIAMLILEKYKIKLNCPTMGIIDLKTTFRAENTFK